eukprot:3867036-Pyramimonas_sp.AAC.1
MTMQGRAIQQIKKEVRERDDRYLHSAPHAGQAQPASSAAANLRPQEANVAQQAELERAIDERNQLVEECTFQQAELRQHKIREESYK